MVEVQHSLGYLLSQMDQVGGLTGLVLGFALGLMLGVLIFYQATARA